jgi:hypothetical protein
VALSETCDRHPSARAAHAATKDSLILTLCGHCTTVNVDALVEGDWLVYDLNELPQTRL